MVKLKKIEELTKEDIVSICDHTFLNRTEGYKAICQKGQNPILLREHAFLSFLEETTKMPQLPYSICIRPEDVIHAKEYLARSGKNIPICSVVGFPDGAWYSTNFKIRETELAITDGASEIDFVLNYKSLHHNNNNLAANEIRDIAQICHKHKVVSKIILEVSELISSEIVYACFLAKTYGIDFVKTSTGFSNTGANPESLRIMKDNFDKGVKISGGVNEQNMAQLLMAASGRNDGLIDLDPMKIRIGESSLIGKLKSSY